MRKYYIKKISIKNIWIGFFLSLCGACSGPENKSETQKPTIEPTKVQKILSNKRIAVIAYDGVEESEIVSSISLLKENGAIVDVISGKTGEIQAFQRQIPGVKISVDKDFRHVTSDVYTSLFIPGGKASVESAIADHLAVQFVIEFELSKKPIASICHGPLLLVAANLVQGRTITAIYKIQNEVIEAGANWKDEAVVLDGNWITSRHPRDVSLFNDAMVILFQSS